MKIREKTAQIGHASLLLHTHYEKGMEFGLFFRNVTEGSHCTIISVGFYKPVVLVNTIILFLDVILKMQNFQLNKISESPSARIVKYNEVRHRCWTDLN